MKRVLALAILAGAGYFAYQRVAGGGASSGAAKVAEELFGHWARGRTDYALPLTEGSQPKQTLEDRTVRNVMNPIVMQTIHKNDVKVLSATKSPDGNETTLDVEQMIGYDPPGVESAVRSAMSVSFRHKATLKKSGEAWKVTKLEIGPPINLWGK